MDFVSIALAKAGFQHMRIGCVDFVSNTFFPAIAAEELGFFSAEGTEAHVHLLRTVAAFPALRDGQVDVLAAPAHSVLRAFPQWKGAKLVVALAQGNPWVVVLGSNVPGERGDAIALKGLRIAVEGLGGFSSTCDGTAIASLPYVISPLPPSSPPMT